MSRLFESFWLVIVTTDKGQQLAVIPVPDNRRMARHIAEVNRKIGHSAHVVKRHEWEAA